MKAAHLTLGIALSLATHALLFARFSSETSTIPATSSPAANKLQASEAQAIAAFDALDQTRLINQTINQITTQIPKLDFSDIKIPTKPQTAPAPAPRQATSKPKPTKTLPPAAQPSTQPTAPSTAQKTSTTSTPAPTAPAYSQAQRARAKADFGNAVYLAIAQKLRAPRGIAQAQAQLSVQFQNGRLTSYSLAKSSGIPEFDQAVIQALKSARFPAPSPAAPKDVVYNLPIIIQ